MVRHVRAFIVFGFTILCFNCKTDEKHSTTDSTTTEVIDSNVETALFEYLSPSTTNINFKNEIVETENFNILLYEYLYNGGGVAIGDINNDGLDDIYFSGNAVENKLYLNQGDFKFKDITNDAQVNGGSGFKTGVTMVDINNDGLLDIYVCKSAVSEDALRRNVLYINNGDLTFTESAKAYGLDDSGYSVQAYFFDSDGDNDLDAYVLNHSSDMRESNSLKVTQNENGDIVMATPKSFENRTDRFYENKGNTFTDISKQAGVLNDAFGLSAVIGDFNNDFKPDIYVCNDYMMPDRLLINKGNNRFEDDIESYFSHTSFSSMGSDFADINNDGHLDLFTLDMSPQDNYRRKMMMMTQNYDKYEKMVQYKFGVQFSKNSLQLNLGSGQFSDISFIDDLAHTEWSWSALMADFDNDGLKDIHITNGIKRDFTNNDYSRFEMDGLQKQLNAKEINLKQWVDQIPSQPVSAFLFQNTGNARFKNVSQSWNSGTPSFSNGSAYTDLNNDGYLDLVVNNINEVPFIMKNRGKELLQNNYLTLELAHQKGQVNIGTRANLTLSDGTVLTEYFTPTRGFLSSSQHKLHFGIKKELTAEKLEIIWPDKKVQVIENPELNQILEVKKASDTILKSQKSNALYFKDVSEKLNGDFTHTENSFIDFKREILLHHKYSEEGPAVAISDVNADGLEDIYLGGALGYPGKLFIQTTAGGFKLNTVSDFEADIIYEDTDALFFDANADGFPDLYVVSGGYAHASGSENYKDRLYLNDGKGQFTKAKSALPDIYESGAVVRAHDINNDGQLDLFVGARVTPGRYPETPKSYLLQNTNGIFTDVTSAWSTGLSDLGMITDAEFSDMDNDGTKELVLAGEWMPISIFKFIDGKFTNNSSNYKLDKKIGWWRSLTIGDLNNDGYNDIIAGNLGLNSFFKSSNTEPATLYYSDFDKNGSVDAVLCTYINGVSYPVHNRDRMLDHIVMLKKRFTRYEPYSYATITDIFTPEELKTAKILKANDFHHTVFTNKNGTSFNATSLHKDTQVSVLNDAVILDLDNDGKNDIISGGNFYGTDAEFGRYDASIGSVLINEGNSQFKSLASKKSGLSIGGNVQHIKPFTIGKTNYLLIVRNNEPVSLFELK
ncbi:VCBS repeat-containing protein [uncultured Psychroserpens sp.]|uniref:VCBS repeat-containing protein n=1 Tax=uncultured Psychroserpens sp. TaxID=255436 RepID=UPI00260BBA9B|nr:VCBS repeat-containing protein [uncultured Psychroserpens sp.]